MAIYKGPHEVVRIDIEKNSVRSITVRPHWATHYNPLTLTEQLNSLLREAANSPTPEQEATEDESPQAMSP